MHETSESGIPFRIMFSDRGEGGQIPSGMYLYCRTHDTEHASTYGICRTPYWLVRISMRTQALYFSFPFNQQHSRNRLQIRVGEC